MNAHPYAGVGLSSAGRVKVLNAIGWAVTDISSDASGGMVNVYAPEGDSPRASLIANGDSGSVNVYNSTDVAGAEELGRFGETLKIRSYRSG